MRVEWLFLRWLVVIGVIAVVAMYAQSWRQSRPQSDYETIPLVRGARSSGMPVRGVMVDPHQRNIYAVVGGPTELSRPADFFLLWKGTNGETFSATFPNGEGAAAALCEVAPDGELRQLHDFRASVDREERVLESPRSSKAEATLQAIVSNLSRQAEPVSRR
jgi:hypothetical protein